MNHPVTFLLGGTIGIIVMCIISATRRMPLPPAPLDEGMIQQMIGDAKAEAYASGDAHGYERGVADERTAQREREKLVDEMFGPSRDEQ